MRNMLALIGLTVVIFFGAGWYFGWYSFTVERGSDGKLKIQGDVDTEKITDNVKQIGDRIGQIANEPPGTKPQTEEKKSDGLLTPSTSTTPGTSTSEVKVGPFRFSVDPNAGK